MAKNNLKMDIVDCKGKVLHFRSLTKEQLVFLAKVQGLVENKPKAKIIKMDKS